jgi:hypothetical protein
MEMRAMMPTATESVWWQGALFTIKGRRETTGGALGLIEADFWAGMGTPCTSPPRGRGVLHPRRADPLPAGR